MDKRPRVPTVIPFNRPTFIGTETRYVQETIAQRKIGPGGEFVRKCQDWLIDTFEVPLALPTGSCTAALEMVAILLDLRAGDEVILPSFAYTSTATAFARTGATMVFVDVEPGTMNLDPDAVEAAVTSNTKAVVLVHYAGIACDMDRLMAITERHGLAIVEDSALAFLAKHRARLCGTLGTFGCFSFHETKAVQCGQGGALLINRPEHVARAEIVYEKGTDRRRFLRDEIDRYTWQDIGSSYALENIRSAVLFAQLENSETITRNRVALWQAYHRLLAPLASQGRVELPAQPDYAEPNGNVFWLKAESEAQRNQLISYLADQGIHAVFHYVPLHSAAAGRRLGRFAGEDRFTTRDSGRLVRLPLFHDLSNVENIADRVFAFFDEN